MFASSGYKDFGIDTGDIPASLRFRSAANTSITKTLSPPTDGKKWTVSVWYKKGQHDFGFQANNGTAASWISVGGNGLTVTRGVVGVNITWNTVTSSIYRDPTSWVHALWVYDSAQATASNRIKVYSNGQQVSTSGTYPSLNEVCEINSAFLHTFMNGNVFNALDGYLSRICLIDGSALTPDSFGYFNTTINEWVSKSASAVKAVVDAGGTNSFMLDFDNATSLTTLGYDKSSKGNNWTLNNFSITAGSSYDHMLDVPGNNYCTMSAIVPPFVGAGGAAAGFTNAGLTGVNVGSGGWVCGGSPWVMTSGSGKWYWEITYAATAGAEQAMYGIHKTTPFGKEILGYTSDPDGYSYGQSGNKFNNNTGTAYGSSWTAGDVIGVTYDAVAGTLTFYKNNVSQGVAFSGLTGDYFPALSTTTTGPSHLNFGQRPFAYTPPTGFKALCQANLTEVPATLLDPTDHHIDITVTKSGDTNFTLPWSADTYDTFFEIKRRDATGDWYQIDGLRGYTKILKSNSTAAETTDANVLGVSGTTCTLKSTLADGTYIISVTKAGLSASRQTNTDGSITSTVSRNVDSGFAIVTYSGNSTSGATFGHGLGAVVAMGVYRARNSGAAENWQVWHKGLSGGTYAVYLNLTNAQGVGNFLASPTSSLSNQLNTTSGLNASGIDYVAYCYADSAIQKSFSYTGNGSADGPYVNLGMKCGRTLLKSALGTTQEWGFLDSARNTYNVANTELRMNSDIAEVPSMATDINSSNIKLRHSTSEGNGNTFTYIGHAWAAVTGKYSLSR